MRRPKPGDEVFRTTGFAPERMVDAFERTAGAFVSLLRSLPPEAGDVPVPGLQWSVAELAAHQYTVLRRVRDPRRASTLDELSALNALCVREVPIRELPRLADLIEAEVAAGRISRRVLPSLWRLRVGRWLTFRLHFGIESDLPMAFAWGAGDMLVHGWELSQATGEPWVIPPPDAAVCLEAILPQSGAWIRPEVRDGPVRSHTISFGHGVAPLEITAGAGAYEARAVDAPALRSSRALDPVALTLHMMGRTEPTGDPVTDDIASWFLPV